MNKFFISILILLSGQNLFGQQAEDKHYFEFWEGTWHQVIENKVDTSATRFVVHRGVNATTFRESWRMVVSPEDILQASGIRSWDPLKQSWVYIWISAADHFQIWDGKKVDGHWYIYKRFNINGDVYLSRQAWIPTADNELMRVSEKSYDEGKTWQLRFREFYRKTAQ